jgi:hypothetical protein
VRCPPGSVSRPSCPPAAPCPGVPLPRRGLLGRIPPRPRYGETLRLPATRPSVLVASRAGTACALSSPSAPADAPGQRRSFNDPALHDWVLQRRRQDLPGSWGTPMHACPAPIRPRRDLGVRPLQRLGVAFRPRYGVGSRNCVNFGARSHGLHTRCLRFTASAILAAQDSLPAGGHPCRTGFDPQGPSRRFPSDCSPYVISFPFSRLCLAHTVYHDLMIAARSRPHPSQGPSPTAGGTPRTPAPPATSAPPPCPLRHSGTEEVLSAR